MSDHRGEPRHATPGFSSAYSTGGNSACSRGRLGSGSGGSLPTPPPPLDQPPTPDTSCSNAGFDYAMFYNSYDNGTRNTQVGNDYKSFDPELFKRRRTIEAMGTTTRLGVASSNSKDGVYGHTASNGGYIVVNHRGYLWAREAGEYTFELPVTDDLTLLWLGDTAVRGYTRANANIVQWLGLKRVVYRATLDEGKYYPLRVMWANGGRPGKFAMRVLAPDGGVIVSNDTTVASPTWCATRVTARRRRAFRRLATRRRMGEARGGARYGKSYAQRVGARSGLQA
jgi:hypothetical protein